MEKCAETLEFQRVSLRKSVTPAGPRPPQGRMVVISDVSSDEVLQALSTDVLRAEVERLRRLVSQANVPPAQQQAIPAKESHVPRRLQAAVEDIDDAYSASSRSASPAPSHGCDFKIRLCSYTRLSAKQVKQPPCIDAPPHCNNIR